MKFAKMRFAPTTILGLICAVQISTSATALADKAVDKASRQLADLRFDEAQTTALSALKKGSRGPAELVDLYMLLGQVSASIGKDKDASNYFHNALSIDGDASLPAGASPKLSDPFDMAKGRLAGATPIALDYESKGEGRVIVTITSDPANLVGGAALLYSADGKSQIKKGRGRNTVKMKIPDGATDLEITALDLHGNRLNEPIELDLDNEGGAKDNKGKDLVAGGSSNDGSTSRPLFTRWQLYAGLTLGAALGGTYYAFKSSGFVKDAEALEDGTEFTMAQRLEELAEEKALYANIGFVAAALLAGTTYWVYSSYSGETEKPTKTSIAPYLAPGEVGVAAAIRF